MPRHSKATGLAALTGLLGVLGILAGLWLTRSSAPSPGGALEPCLDLSLKAWEETEPTRRRALCRQALERWRSLAPESRAQTRWTEWLDRLSEHPSLQDLPALGALRRTLNERIERWGGATGFWTPQHEAMVRLMFSAWLEESLGEKGEAWANIQTDRLAALRHAFIFRPGGHLPELVDLLSDAELLKRGLGPNHRHQVTYHLLGTLFNQARFEEMDRFLTRALPPMKGQRWAAVGAGLGPEALWASEASEVPCTIQDVERSFEPFWAWCEEQLPALRGRARVFGGPSETGLEPGSHDGILLCEVLHTFYAGPDPQPVPREVYPWLRSVKAALRPGGRLVVIEESNTFKTLEGPVALLREAGFSEIVIHDEGYRFMVAQAP